MEDTPLNRLPKGKYLVMFDGYCNLCNGAVRFVLERDPRSRFYFAPLDSDIAAHILEAHPVSDRDSLILYHDGKVYDRSSAVLRIAGKLRGLWPVFVVFLALPKILRDALYKWIARNRYRWFGRRETCMVPDVDYSDRFLG